MAQHSLWHRVSRKRAFTLIEVLLAVGIIAVIAGVTIQAINPRKSMLAAWDARRLHHAHEQESAIYQYLVDFGELPHSDQIPEGEANAEWICIRGYTDSSCVNLDPILVPEYLGNLPVDDLRQCAQHTGYKVYKISDRPFVFSPYMGKLPGDAVDPVDCSIPSIVFEQVIDNGDEGFVTYQDGTGTWFMHEFDPVYQEGYNNTHVYAHFETPQDVSAEWHFHVVPGTDYAVYATWPVYNYFPIVSYGVYDDQTPEVSVAVSQRDSPDDITYGGRVWEKIGEYHADTNALAVVLWTDGEQCPGPYCYMFADAVAIVPVN